MCSILDGSNGLFGSKFCSTTNHRTVWKRANGRPEKSGPRGGDHGGAKDQRTNQKSRFVTKTAFLQSSNAQTSFSRSREQIQPTQFNERLPLWIYPSISLSNVAESDTRNKILSILFFIDDRCTWNNWRRCKSREGARKWELKFFFQLPVMITITALYFFPNKCLRHISYFQSCVFLYWVVTFT